MSRSYPAIRLPLPRLRFQSYPRATALSQLRLLVQHLMNAASNPDFLRGTALLNEIGHKRGLSRREFLLSTLVTSAAVGLAPIRAAAVAAGEMRGVGMAAKPSWVERPMRWAQLTLVEDDPAKLDIGFWLDYFRRTRSDAVCLSGGGCVAYYPTQIPFHHRSRWLGERDVLGELIAGCRKLGMVVIVRTDPHATYDDVEAAHPDWIAVEADGKPRRHWASPDMWVTCALGPYNFEFMTEVKKELMARYRMEGIFINRWDGSGMCYCQHCRNNFKAATGCQLPT